MKKLILSLFAVATMFVACDKDDNLDQAAIAPDMEVSVNNANDVDVDGLVGRLISSTRKNGTKSSSASKDAVRGTSTITIFTGVVN